MSDSSKKIIKHAHEQRLAKMKQVAFETLNQRAESRLLSVRKSIAKNLLEAAKKPSWLQKSDFEKLKKTADTRGHVMVHHNDGEGQEHVSVVHHDMMKHLHEPKILYDGRKGK